MKFFYAIIFIGVIAIPFGCINAGDDNQSSTEISETEANVLDTIIYSSPENYSKVLNNYETSRKVEVRSYKDMLDLFEELNYTPEAWQAGIREIPRIYLPLIGEKWGSKTTKEITIENKKRLFFRGLAPLILRANELITIDRTHLERIRSSFIQNSSLSEEDQSWTKKLAKLYKVEFGEGKIATSALEELWAKVDIVPVSLALAQAAEESGWGTSRFAAQGNAVYGQWTWGENAIIPEQQRKELGNYGIASFETLQQSICAYMLNLNTHNAYASLRTKRAELRTNDQKITGHILAGQLTKYSERGEEYVNGLRSLMEYNRLSPADDAYLSDDPPIYLIPVAD
jgi:uncharacterized FlgJ-related protein